MNIVNTDDEEKMKSEYEINCALERYADTVRRICLLHLKNYVMDTDKSEVLEAVLSLPKKYKEAVYLHYYEGYTASEISKMIGKKENTVYTLLSRARTLLKEKLGGEDFE